MVSVISKINRYLTFAYILTYFMKKSDKALYKNTLALC